MESTKLNKEQAKTEIRKLVEDFKLNYEKHRKELEANTETKLIEPLFEILGWTKDDFVKQEKAHRGDKSGHADYAFKIGDKIVFFLEAKKVGIPLEKEADKQVISYALSKRIPFAVSTNFETLNIFCVEQEKAITNKFRVFSSPDEYVDNFEELFFLSKESFEQNIILKKAESEGRLKRRISIDKALLEDLMHIRKLISDDIEKKYAGKYQINEKDEIVQRIIDRLIFIRRCEDIGINPDNISIEELRHLPHNKCYPRLKEIFKKYNDVYNSGLFAIAKDNDCDVINVDGEIIQKLAYYLYESKDKEYIYNFDWIDADVLGQVYEQYLGKILAQTKSGKSKLKDGQAHRKEQGIYYTPTYIVDYIVKNTVGELLKDKKVDVTKIKILDPACGSGSFLIKAFDYMDKHLSKDEGTKQHRLDSQGAYSTKTEILKNNLYGVDLDNKAVEITKLNLLLKAAEKGRKLPDELDSHIRHGNSLIDDENIDKNAFKWDGDFKEGTFDVVIGNPPYVSINQVPVDNRKYYSGKYLSFVNKGDIFSLFIESAINKFVRSNGLIGFIIPNTILNNSSFRDMRRVILENCTIEKIVNLKGGVFDSASVDTIIIILHKQKPSKKHLIKIYDDIQIKSGVYTEATQSSWLEDSNYNFFIKANTSVENMFDRIKSKSINLGTISLINQGIKTGDDKSFIFSEKKNDVCKKVLFGRDISRYSTSFSNKYVVYDRKKLMNPRDETIFTSNSKIMVQLIRNPSLRRRIIATMDEEKYYTISSITNLRLNAEDYSYKFILGIVNSKIVNYFFMTKFIDVNIKPMYLAQIPIPRISLGEQRELIDLVDKMLAINKKLVEIGDKNTSETAKLKEEIEKTDREIDNLVYKLYGITEDEKKLIEESLR